MFALMPLLSGQKRELYIIDGRSSCCLDPYTIQSFFEIVQMFVSIPQIIVLTVVLSQVASTLDLLKNRLLGIVRKNEWPLHETSLHCSVRGNGGQAFEVQQLQQLRQQKHL